MPAHCSNEPAPECKRKIPKRQRVDSTFFPRKRSDAPIPEISSCKPFEKHPTILSGIISIQTGPINQNLSHKQVIYPKVISMFGGLAQVPQRTAFALHQGHF
jgi:hypothetical protein